MTWVFIDIFSYNCLCFDWFYWSYEHMTRIERKKGQEMQSFGTVCILNLKSTSHFFIWLLYSALNVFHSSGVHWDDSRRQSNRLTCFERFCLSSFFFFWCAHGLGFQAIWTPRWAPPPLRNPMRRMQGFLMTTFQRERRWGLECGKRRIFALKCLRHSS